MSVHACVSKPGRGWFSSWTNTLDPTTVQVMETTGRKNTLTESRTKTRSSAPFLILHSQAFMWEHITIISSGARFVAWTWWEVSFVKTQNNRGVGTHLETDAHRAATICPQPGASSVKTTLSMAMFGEATAVRASSSRLADAVTVKNVLYTAHITRKKCMRWAF